MLLYNGTSWQTLTFPNNYQLGKLYSIQILQNSSGSVSEAFIGGRSSDNNSDGVILYWNGSWQVSQVNSRIYSLSMYDGDGDGTAEFGLAVGRNGAVFSYDGNSWQSMATLTSNDLLAVKVINEQDTWVVSENGGRYHWNGNSWQAITAGVSTNRDLHALSIIAPKISAKSTWYDVIN